MKFETYHQEKRYYEREATEEEFLEWYHRQDLGTYEKPSVTVDNLIFGWDRGELKILMVQRKAHPSINQYAFPGGFLKKTESPDECAIREAEEETGLDLTAHHLQQFRTVGTPGRDPRTWVITIAYFVFLPTMEGLKIQAGGDAKDAKWLTLQVVDGKVTLRVGQNIPLEELAFDHREILEAAVAKIQEDFSKPNGIVGVLGDAPTADKIDQLKKILDL